MQLNQLLQNLLGNSGGSRSAGADALPVRVLNDLTRVVNAESAKVLLSALQRATGTTGTTALAQLPIVSAKVTVPTASGTSSQPTQVRLTVDVQGKNVVLPVPVTRAQQQQIQQLQQQAPQQPLLLIAKSVSRPAASQPQLNLQLVSLKAPKQPVDIKLPLAQLPKVAAEALLQSVVQQRRPQSPLLTQRNMQTAALSEAGRPPTWPTGPNQPATAAPPGMLLKQASQLTPGQLQQSLQSLIRTTLALQGNADAMPREALVSVLQAVIRQLPQGESMQQPQQLKQWVNDWFAAKPVTSASQQQMGSLGKMLMMLLGMALQKPANTSSQPGPSLTGAQQQTANQLTQALIDQILRPAPRTSGDANITGEVRERINQLLQQLPQTQLQRLMQLFTAAVNSAQTSQARLAESGAATPEYYVLLPTNAQQPDQQHELLIRREQERGSDGEQGRTLWLFTLRFELKEYGPLLVKGRYHPAGTRVDFYTESDRAQQALETKLDKLNQRFQELEVNGLNLTVQKGRVPETLAKQQSGIIRVTV